jgi:hypothetical protein
MKRAYTVVLYPDDSRASSVATIDVEQIRLEHVAAENISRATAMAQEQAATHERGPDDPLDWVVLFMCDGLHRDVQNDRDEEPSFTREECRALFEVLMFGPRSLTADMATGILDKLRPVLNDKAKTPKGEQG